MTEMLHFGYGPSVLAPPYIVQRSKECKFGNVAYFGQVPREARCADGVAEGRSNERWRRCALA